MKTSPYYLVEQSDPDVHHDQTTCASGQQILSVNKRSGTNGWPMCKHCRDM